jgi:hypothetical protein
MVPAALAAQVLPEEPADVAVAHDAMARRIKGRLKRSGQIIYVSWNRHLIFKTGLIIPDAVLF